MVGGIAFASTTKGAVWYYQRSGSGVGNDPVVFNAVPKYENPVFDVSSTGYTKPAAVDMDGDGDQVPSVCMACESGRKLVVARRLCVL